MAGAILKMMFGMKMEQERLSILRSLSGLLSAGFTLSESLGECIGMTRHPRMKLTLTQILNHVESGYPFSIALAQSKLVNPFLVAVIRSGESSGDIQSAIDQSADILDTSYQGRLERSAVMIYPTLLMGVTIAAAIFLSVGVIPQMEMIYKHAGVCLPMLTRVIFGLGKGLMAASLGVFAALPLLGIGTVRRKIFTWLEFMAGKIPGWAAMSQLFHTQIWASMLGVLLRNHVPLPEALALTASAVPVPALKRQLLQIQKRIEEGQAPAVAFAAASWIPDLAKRLIRAGDRSGDLGSACQRIAILYEREYRMVSKRFLAIIEPVAVLTAGVVVTLLALGVVLPIADLGTLL